MRDRVTVFGTGALAMRLGAELAGHGLPVTLVGSWRQGLAALHRGGVQVEEDGRIHRRWVGVAELGAELAPAPLVLVLVKSHQTASVAPWAARAAGDEGVVATLQNGLGNAELLARAAGEARTVTGVTSLGATVAGPGRVRTGGWGETIVGDSPAARRAVGILTAGGLALRLSERLESAVWGKLAVSCAINPLTALHRVPNGALLETRELRRTLIAAAGEVAAVAAARGIALEGDPVAAALEVARRTADNRSSMLQDVERGAPTEIDAINGAVVAYARRLGVPAPVNEALWQQVAELSRHHRRGAARAVGGAR